MTENCIREAAQVIRRGGLVAFPTETVYGLGANALHPLAVAKIFELKERPSFDPLIVHIATLDQLTELCGSVHENVYRLVEHFWPGPLTVVLPKREVVPDLVTSGLPTVGIRMPDNEIALQLIRESGCPIAAPSANKFGQLSPVEASHVRKQLPGVDYILEGGKTTVGLESTIVSVEGRVCRLLRPGFITPDDIEKALPGVFVFDQSKPETLVAPGLLKSHYSPKKPLYFIGSSEAAFPHSSGVIAHGKQGRQYVAEKILFTSLSFNKTEVAANLFSALHDMEEDTSVQQIYIETIEETGLGVAIMDRLRKAAYQYQEK